MKKILLVAFLFSAKNLFSQTIIQRDPEIEQMVKEVSADSLKMLHKNIGCFWHKKYIKHANKSKAWYWRSKKLGIESDLMNLQNNLMADFLQLLIPQHLQPDKRRVDTTLITWQCNGNT